MREPFGPGTWSIIVVGVPDGAVSLISSCTEIITHFSYFRIPFAAVNMTTAVTAIKANLGVTVFAYLFTLLAAGWSLLWSIAVSGTMEQTFTCNAQGVCNANYGLLFLLFLSFFFAHQVLQVSVQSDMETIKVHHPLLCNST